MSSFYFNSQLSSFNDAFVNILELFDSDVVTGIIYLLLKNSKPEFEVNPIRKNLMELN